MRPWVFFPHTSLAQFRSHLPVYPPPDMRVRFFHHSEYAESTWLLQLYPSIRGSDAVGLSAPAAPLPRFSLFLRAQDRKSTRLNSSHVAISYAVFCLKKKNNHI